MEITEEQAEVVKEYDRITKLIDTVEDALRQSGNAEFWRDFEAILPSMLKHQKKYHDKIHAIVDLKSVTDGVPEDKIKYFDVVTKL